ncbi:hypothetical protein Pelo_12172 [Pelomyxa schiedti]|nr:hypothetical protein Pelo_12172 [Pelomyxa schiedti]
MGFSFCSVVRISKLPTCLGMYDRIVYKSGGISIDFKRWDVLFPGSPCIWSLVYSFPFSNVRSLSFNLSPGGALLAACDLFGTFLHPSSVSPSIHSRLEHTFFCIYPTTFSYPNTNLGEPVLTLLGNLANSPRLYALHPDIHLIVTTWLCDNNSVDWQRILHAVSSVKALEQLHACLITRTQCRGCDRSEAYSLAAALALPQQPPSSNRDALSLPIETQPLSFNLELMEEVAVVGLNDTEVFTHAQDICYSILGAFGQGLQIDCVKAILPHMQAHIIWDEQAKADFASLSSFLPSEEFLEYLTRFLFHTDPSVRTWACGMFLSILSLSANSPSLGKFSGDPLFITNGYPNDETVIASPIPPKKPDVRNLVRMFLAHSQNVSGCESIAHQLVSAISATDIQGNVPDLINAAMQAILSLTPSTPTTAIHAYILLLDSLLWHYPLPSLLNSAAGCVGGLVRLAFELHSPQVCRIIRTTLELLLFGKPGTWAPEESFSPQLVIAQSNQCAIKVLQIPEFVSEQFILSCQVQSYKVSRAVLEEPDTTESLAVHLVSECAAISMEYPHRLLETEFSTISSAASHLQVTNALHTLYDLCVCDSTVLNAFVQSKWFSFLSRFLRVTPMSTEDYTVLESILNLLSFAFQRLMPTPSDQDQIAQYVIENLLHTLTQFSNQSSRQPVIVSILRFLSCPFIYENYPRTSLVTILEAILTETTDSQVRLSGLSCLLHILLNSTEEPLPPSGLAIILGRYANNFCEDGSRKLFKLSTVCLCALENDSLSSPLEDCTSFLSLTSDKDPILRTAALVLLTRCTENASDSVLVSFMAELVRSSVVNLFNSNECWSIRTASAQFLNNWFYRMDHLSATSKGDISEDHENGLLDTMRRISNDIRVSMKTIPTDFHECPRAFQYSILKLLYWVAVQSPEHLEVKFRSLWSQLPNFTQEDRSSETVFNNAPSLVLQFLCAYLDHPLPPLCCDPELPPLEVSTLFSFLEYTDESIPPQVLFILTRVALLCGSPTLAQEILLWLLNLLEEPVTVPKCSVRGIYVALNTIINSLPLIGGEALAPDSVVNSPFLERLVPRKRNHRLHFKQAQQNLMDSSSLQRGICANICLLLLTCMRDPEKQHLFYPEQVQLLHCVIDKSQQAMDLFLQEEGFEDVIDCIHATLSLQQTGDLRSVTCFFQFILNLTWKFPEEKQIVAKLGAFDLLTRHWSVIQRNPELLELSLQFTLSMLSERSVAHTLFEKESRSETSSALFSAFQDALLIPEAFTLACSCLQLIATSKSSVGKMLKSGIVNSFWSSLKELTVSSKNKEEQTTLDSLNMLLHLLGTISLTPGGRETMVALQDPNPFTLLAEFLTHTNSCVQTFSSFILDNFSTVSPHPMSNNESFAKSVWIAQKQAYSVVPLNVELVMHCSSILCALMLNQQVLERYSTWGPASVLGKMLSQSKNTLKKVEQGSQTDKDSTSIMLDCCVSNISILLDLVLGL